MACLHPIQLRNKFGQYFTVPCGKCLNCAEIKRKQWVYRMECESQYSDDTLFITLTYNVENLVFGEVAPTLVKSDLSDFHRRLKRKLKHYCSIRYFVSGEYGDKELRPHYHGIYFINYKNYEDSVKERIDYVSYTFSKVWDKGFIEVDNADFGALYYCAKYTAKGLCEVPPGSERPFQLCSKHPCIGYRYISQNRNFLRKNANPRWRRFDADAPRDCTQVTDNIGKSFPIPRIFLKEIYGDEKLNWYDWQNLLNLQAENRRKQLKLSEEAFFRKFPHLTYEDYVNFCNNQIVEYEKTVKRLKDKYED